MFGLFKKPIDRSVAIKEFADVLERIMKRLDEISRNGGIEISPLYLKETNAFAYIIGWISIQTSKLSAANRHIFSAELTGEWAERMSQANKAIEGTAFIQSRINTYREAMGEGGGLGWHSSIVFQYMKYIGVESSEEVALLGAYSSSIPIIIEGLTSFLNDINKEYKFV